MQVWFGWISDRLKKRKLFIILAIFIGPRKVSGPWGSALWSLARFLIGRRDTNIAT